MPSPGRHRLRLLGHLLEVPGVIGVAASLRFGDLPLLPHARTGGRRGTSPVLRGVTAGYGSHGVKLPNGWRG